MQGKEDLGGPEESLVWPHSFPAGQGPPTGHREGVTYKMAHIWPDGAAFPRKTCPRSPGLQSPFKDEEENSGRDFLKVMALPRGGRPPATPLPQAHLRGLGEFSGLP